MSGKVRAVVVFHASLALNHDLRTFSFDMLEELGPGHMLKLLLIADVTAELGALIHGMLLQLAHGFPDDHAILVILVALVGELAEVNAVL
jgi:hypothetical protein